MQVVRSSRTLLCGLEHDLFDRKGRARAINMLIGRHKKKDLSHDHEVRLIAFVMMKGSQKQKAILGTQVREQHPGKCTSITS